MAAAPFDVTRANRWFAVEANNQAWDFVELADRSDADTEKMIEAAHAACFHWNQVGTPVNYVRAQTLLTMAYVRAGISEAALRHADKCLRASDALGEDQTLWDRACAFGSVAAALALANDRGIVAEFGVLDAVDAETLRARAIEIAASFDDPADTAQFDALFLRKNSTFAE